MQKHLFVGRHRLVGALGMLRLELGVGLCRLGNGLRGHEEPLHFLHERCHVWVGPLWRRWRWRWRETSNMPKLVHEEKPAFGLASPGQPCKDNLDLGVGLTCQGELLEDDAEVHPDKDDPHQGTSSGLVEEPDVARQDI